MLEKMVDGKVVQCTPEEESEIRAEWLANDTISKKNQPYDEETQELMKKYPDVLRAIDALYQKLGM